MTVYADVFVIVNLYIDFFLLWCVRRFLRLQAKGWRLVAGGLCGALCGLVSLFPMAGWASLLAGGGSAGCLGCGFLPFGVAAAGAGVVMPVDFLLFTGWGVFVPDPLFGPGPGGGGGACCVL